MSKGALAATVAAVGSLATGAWTGLGALFSIAGQAGEACEEALRLARRADATAASCIACGAFQAPPASWTWQDATLVLAVGLCVGGVLGWKAARFFTPGLAAAAPIEAPPPPPPARDPAWIAAPPPPRRGREATDLDPDVVDVDALPSKRKGHAVDATQWEPDW